ncbi:MAG: response regulator transcription factor [Pseudomonadota bacterium]
MMRALLIDGDEAALASLTTAMTQDGFLVDGAIESESALDYLICNRYDVIVLNYAIEDLSGRRLYHRLSAAGLITPILVIASREERSEAANIVEVTKDALFVAPIDTEELLAWALALIDFTNIFVGFMDFPSVPRPATRKQASAKVAKSPGSIDLTLHEKKLLGFLLKNRGKTVRKSEILEQVWNSDEEEIFTNTVEVYITRLRRKLGAHGQNLLTIRGVGYRFEL